MASYARISPRESTVSAVHASFVEPYSPLTSPWRDALEKFLACDEFLWKSSSSKTFCGKWFVEHYDFLARNCWEMTNARAHVDTLFFFIFFCVLCEVGREICFLFFKEDGKVYVLFSSFWLANLSRTRLRSTSILLIFSLKRVAFGVSSRFVLERTQWNSMCAKRIDNSRHDRVTRVFPEIVASIRIELFSCVFLSFLLLQFRLNCSLKRFCCV